jgi:hypothetical protein
MNTQKIKTCETKSTHGQMNSEENIPYSGGASPSYHRCATINAAGEAAHLGMIGGEKNQRCNLHVPWVCSSPSE